MCIFIGIVRHLKRLYAGASDDSQRMTEVSREKVLLSENLQIKIILDV